MESKKINQLATELTPALSDLTIIGDPTTGISKKITLSQMASLFTGTVEEYANLASFPLVGVADTIYIATNTNILYRWDTTLSAYAELSPNIVTSLVFSDANGFDGTISLVGSVATLTITTALTTGSVPFIGASGALSQDNDNLFWDDTNNRLGIGTKLPTNALDVFGSGIIGRLNGTSTNNAFLGFASAGTNKWSIGNVQSDHRFRIYSEANTSELVSVLQTGEFGIGIANPTTKLHIDGGASALIANLDANVSVAKSVSFRSDNSARFNIEVSGTESGSNAGANFFIRRYSDAGSLIDTPLTITRSTGAISLAGALSGTSASFSSTITAIGYSKFWDGTQGFNIGAFTAGANYGAIYAANVTPSNTNFALVSNGASTYLNATNDAGMTIDNGTKGIFLVSSGNIGIATSNPSTLFHIAASRTSGTNVNVITLSDNVTGVQTGGFGTRIIGTSNNGQAKSAIAFEADGGTNNDTAIAFYTQFSAASLDRRMTINRNGFVGIGTAGPAQVLDVRKATANGDTQFNFVNSQNSSSGNLSVTSSIYLGFYDDSGGTANANRIVSGKLGDYTTAPNASSFLAFHTTNANTTTERMRIQTLSAGGYLKASNDGSTYVSITSPYHEFNNNANSNNTIFYSTHASLNTDGIIRIDGLRNTSNNSYYVLTYYNATQGNYRFRIADSGNVTNVNNSYGAISDIKLKENITDATPKLDNLLKIKIRNYNYIGSEEKQLGVIAQELEEIFPAMIEQHEDFEEIETIDEEGNTIKEKQSLGTVTKSVKYSVFVPMLIKAIQELEARVKQLESK